jgi:hypothetical protein
MIEFKPDAEYGYLSDGKMYWNIKLQPIVCGSRKNWALLMVYHDDHPQKTWGCSINIYPVTPSSDEMLERMNAARIESQHIPNTIRDCFGNVHLSVESRISYERSRITIASAAALLRQAMRWVTAFELGLIDPKTWANFQGYGGCAVIPEQILNTSEENMSAQAHPPINQPTATAG